MALVNKQDPKKIFASQAPEQDIPAQFNNYERGWDESRKNNGKPTIKQFNKLQQLTDEKILWMHQNGAALPFDEEMEYVEGAVVVKDGELKQKNGSDWLPVTKKDIEASNIQYGAINQEQFNNGIDSIADMLAIISPDDNSRVHVNGVGDFIYNSSSSDPILGGWVPSGNFVSVSTFGVLPEGDRTATTTGIQAAINYVKARFGTGTVFFPPTDGLERYYQADELFVYEGITLSGLGGKNNGVYGATIYLQSVKPDSDIEHYFNANFTFENLRCKKTHFKLYSKTNASRSAAFMIIKFNNMTLDGTNTEGIGSVSGDAIQVRNVTFDVHLNETYINNYLGAAFSVVSDNASTDTPYFATGVFCTISQSKFYNNGYGIYATGASADSTDIHADELLLDNNEIGVYADGTRLSGMGELSINIQNSRTELNHQYAFQVLNGAQFSYDGWCMATGSTSNKIYVDDASYMFLSGRYNQVSFEGQSLKSKINFKQGTINTISTFSNCIHNIPSPAIASNNSTPAAYQRKVAMQLNFSGGNLTTQIIGKGVQSGRYYNGLSYGVISSDSLSAPITAGGSTVTVGSGDSSYTIALSSNSDLNFSFANDLVVWLGNMNVISNNTGVNFRLSGTVPASGNGVSLTLNNVLTHQNISIPSLNGSAIIQFDYWCI